MAEDIMVQNQNVYIPSIEATDIYNHTKRGRFIKVDYCGMLPYSLELKKLKEVGLKVRGKDKQLSNDLINVKFNIPVMSAEGINKSINNKIAIYKNQLKQIERQDVAEKINGKIEYFRECKERANAEEWEGKDLNNIRKLLYTDGFTITLTDKAGKQTQVKYVLYKRSASKSRLGEVLFIREPLYQKMMGWCHMGLKFDDTDLPSLMAYESLVSSSIVNTIKINPKNILIVSDIKNIFYHDCQVVRAGAGGLLDSFTEVAGIESNLFDGQSLLQETYFPSGKAMMLLRNHMFKSAAFRCDIQQFLQDKCPTGVDYKDWQIYDMFGNLKLAKDVHMITTPSSLKCLKFGDLWDHWVQVVTDEGCQFGIVTYESGSKRGHDQEGNILQQMSYQMVNSLPANFDDIEKLATYEREYVKQIKDSDSAYVRHLEANISDNNSNELWVNIYNLNPEVVGHEIFRNYRSRQTGSHINYVKGGKIRLPGDYCYLCGNPVEMLYHAIGADYCGEVLTSNQVYTRLWEFSREYTCFRNPHTSPSNIFIACNTKNEQIERYMPNLSKNIVIVNAKDFPIQRILSGADYDGDQMVIFDSPQLLKIAKKAYDKYLPCYNGVPDEDKFYANDNFGRSEVDNILGKSKYTIGTVVNLGQWAISRYWETGNEKYHKIVDVCTVLSEISIDMAKKLYDIDPEREINNLRKKITGKKPTFFKYVSQDENIEAQTRDHKCPMDYLQKILVFDSAGARKNIELRDLLVKQNFSKRDRKQVPLILKFISEMDGQIRYIKALSGKTDKEKNILIEKIKYHYETLMSRRTVKPDSMYALLILADSEYKRIFTRLLMMLEKTQKHVYAKAFK